MAPIPPAEEEDLEDATYASSGVWEAWLGSALAFGFLGISLTWVGIGLAWVMDFVGGLLVGILWGCPCFLGAMVFSFSFFFSLFVYVIGGSRVLRHGAAFGFFLQFSFNFSFLCRIGTFF